MAKAFFLNIPASGHVNPTLPLARDLAARGEEVLYGCGESFRAPIEAAGARLVPCPTRAWDATAEPVEPRRMMFHMFDCVLEHALEVAPVMEARLRAEAPDYVLCDAMCLWGRLLATKLGLPWIRLFTSYAMNAAYNPWARDSEAAFRDDPAAAIAVGEAARRAAEELGVPPFDIRELFSSPAPTNLVFVDRGFHPRAETFGERYVFAGPQLERGEEPGDLPFGRLDASRPLLYVSLGTVFSRWPEFYQACFEAFAGSSWQVVLSFGRHMELGELGPVPDNFLVAPHVPQKEVLARARVFISHGGMNSTMESLAAGVPLVVVPCMPEQSLTASRVAELEVGVHVPRSEMRPETLRAAVARVVERPSFAANARRFAAAAREDARDLRAVDVVWGWRQRERVV